MAYISDGYGGMHWAPDSSGSLAPAPKDLSQYSAILKQYYRPDGQYTPDVIPKLQEAIRALSNAGTVNPMTGQRMYTGNPTPQDMQMINSLMSQNKDLFVNHGGRSLTDVLSHGAEYGTEAAVYAGLAYGGGLAAGQALGGGAAGAAVGPASGVNAGIGTGAVTSGGTAVGGTVGAGTGITGATVSGLGTGATTTGGLGNTAAQVGASSATPSGGLSGGAGPSGVGASTAGGSNAGVGVGANTAGTGLGSGMTTGPAATGVSTASNPSGFGSFMNSLFGGGGTGTAAGSTSGWGGFLAQVGLDYWASQEAQRNAERAAGAADPFASQRPQYQRQLANLMANPNSIVDDPSYKFRFDQGQQALERSNVAKGYLGSGNMGYDLINYGQGAASTELNNQKNFLSGLAGAGFGPGNSGTILANGYNNSLDQQYQAISGLGTLARNYLGTNRNTNGNGAVL